MKTAAAAFTSDGVNRQNILLPLATLVQSMEGLLANAIEWGIPYGTPSNISHDSCRPCGWSEPRGVYIAKDRSRQVGLVHEPETVDESEVIAAARRGFILRTQAERAEPFTDDLEDRISAHSTEARRFWHGEAAAAVEPGLAARMFPMFFDTGTDHVDKDGLVDFEYLTSCTKQIFPGVFHEQSQDLVLFAHRHFRRSYSLLNTVNDYVLRSFTEVAQTKGVAGRLRLDPDMVGHPDSARSQIELEYWHGPKYTDDIAMIPDGVAEHKSTERDRYFSGIDKTQVWWKSPETRGGVSKEKFRTFEIEELIEDESPGLDDGKFGCRYAHAEYDLQGEVISHFDGAIRAYSSDAYLDRIGRKIHRAGKYADYTKTFRLDGAIPVDLWKRVLTDWYRGNTLIPEYLGAPEEEPLDDPMPDKGQPSCVPALAALLALGKDSSPPTDRPTLVVENRIAIKSASVPAVEIGRDKVAEFMTQWSDESISSIAADSVNANLATIRLAGEAPKAGDWAAIAVPLAVAITEEGKKGALERVALAVEWSTNSVKTRLSIAGVAAHVAGLLRDSAQIVDPSSPASSWIENFRDALLAHAPDLDEKVDWPASAAHTGRLTVIQESDTEFAVRVPEAALSKISINGDSV